MAPTILSNSIVLADAIISDEKENRKLIYTVRTDHELTIQPSNTSSEQSHFWITRSEIVWKNVVIFTVLHLSAFYGIYLMILGQNVFSFVLSYCFAILGGMGITAGAHRLWCHKSYKATWQLKLILTIGNLIAFQNSIYDWVRDHRLHHKFTDTDADPHNSSRGFFFSHMGWLLVRKHPEIRHKGKIIDMSDLECDPFVMFQKKYYGYLMPIFCFIIPTLIPWYFLNETLWNSWFGATALRYVFSLHSTWLVNSAAHIYGMRPYDRTIAPTENKFVSILAFGEGFHNYHHVFPWDYKTSEFGFYSLNLTKAFIDFFAKIGWAYDLKTVSEETIRKRAARTGDGTRGKLSIESDNFKNMPDEKLIWGWDDKDMDLDDKKNALILN